MSATLKYFSQLEDFEPLLFFYILLLEPESLWFLATCAGLVVTVSLGRF